MRYIGFDADDTLWENVIYFNEVENAFVEMMKPFASVESMQKILFSTEMRNMEIYGYGVKPFILSLIETAIKESNGAFPQQDILRLIEMGKSILRQEIVLLSGVHQVLERLQKSNSYLVLATKGDALDQENKLERSGLKSYFHHVEVMSDKKADNYQILFNKLKIRASEFTMIGNSVRSDIIPVLELGGHAIHVPFHSTWQHEEVDNVIHDFPVCKSLNQVFDFLDIGNSL